MNRVRPITLGRVLLIAGFVCFGAGPAVGQDPQAPPAEPPPQQAPSKRPFRGLFGGASAVDDRKQSLDLAGSVFAAYVQNLAADAVPGQQQPTDTTYMGAGTSLRYSRQWDASAVGAFTEGGFAYLPTESAAEGSWIDRWSVGGSGTYSKPLGRRTTFGASGMTLYSPYYEFGGSLFSPGTVSSPTRVPGLDVVVARDPSIRWSGTVNLDEQLTRWGTVSVYYAILGNTYLSQSSERSDRVDHVAGARYRYRLNRFVSVRAGYGYRFYSTSIGRNGQHEFDVGLDGAYGFSRSYAITSRTTFSFQVAPSLFVGERYAVSGGPEGEDPQTVSDPSLRFFLGGSADLQQTWGQTWAARAAYLRTAGYEVGFDRPILRDTTTATVSGLLSTRIDFSAAAAISTGSVGFTGANRGFATTTATANLRAALTSVLAAYTQYFYYKYDFQRGVGLPSDMSPRFDRQGVSAGLSLWLPLL